MPADDGVSPLRESMKQDYQHIAHACKKPATFIARQLLVEIKRLGALHLFFVMIYAV